MESFDLFNLIMLAFAGFAALAACASACAAWVAVHRQTQAAKMHDAAVIDRLFVHFSAQLSELESMANHVHAEDVYVEKWREACWERISKLIDTASPPVRIDLYNLMDMDLWIESDWSCPCSAAQMAIRFKNICIDLREIAERHGVPVFHLSLL